MPDRLSDLHMHLNGSFSLAFLEKCALRNDAEVNFTHLLTLREQYTSLIQPKPSAKFITLIWEQFAQIHQIIQSLADVYDGAIDVIQTSKASYMEIRTRPKEIQDASWQEYVAAFVNGLTQGYVIDKTKTARGILSLDRTKDTAARALEIIDEVAQEKAASGLLVGIDISGNPVEARTLTGATLATVLQYALTKDIGIAIHLGEVETTTERHDVDIILETLNAWHQANYSAAKNPLHGKVRLGHGIFLSEAQRTLIKQLQIPIEICPTCHKKVNWWNTNDLHPVTAIYKHWQDPVVSGTDDEIIFGANAEEENQTVLTLLGYPANESYAKARIHQALFRF
jgi:adenosine deaminase